MSEVEKRIGILKWFNEAEGFGFIRVHNTSEDALLHESLIPDTMLASVKTGAEFEFLCARGERGLNVKQVLRVTPQEEMWRTVTIKWFNSKIGYGFVTHDANGPDIFLHASLANKLGCRLVVGDKLQAISVVDGEGRLRVVAVCLPGGPVPAAQGGPTAPQGYPAAAGATVPAQGPATVPALPVASQGPNGA